MKVSSKHIIALISIMLIYILLAGIGAYGTIGIFLFPIFSIPLTVCLINNNFQKGIGFLFNVTVITGIYLITDSIESILVYTVAVSIPAYVISLCYKRKASIPHIIMYTSVSVIASIFIYLGSMRYLGVDYIKQFIVSVDQIKLLYFNALETLKQSMPQEALSQFGEIKGLIGTTLDTMKMVYPALLLILGVVLTTLQMLMLNLILRIKKIKTLPLRQLFNFRLSKVAVFLLFLAMIATLSITDLNNVGLIVALNIIVFLQNLLQIIGVIAAVVLISRSAMNMGLRVLLYVLVFILFTIYPGILMVFGCLDTIFNYRKSEIIV